MKPNSLLLSLAVFKFHDASGSRRRTRGRRTVELGHQNRPTLRCGWLLAKWTLIWTSKGAMVGLPAMNQTLLGLPQELETEEEQACAHGRREATQILPTVAQ